jgi:predicted transcriptional regulator
MPRSRPARDIPPPLELECLKALWRIGDGTVKDVRKVLTEQRNLAYTTVMTVLDRLVRRGGVERRKEGRAFVYTPRVGRDELRRLAVEELVDSFFDGSKEALLAYLASQAPAAPARPAERPAPDSGPPEDDSLETVLL